MKKVITYMISMFMYFLFTIHLHAQEGTVFEFEAVKPSREIYEISFQFFNAEQIQSIHIDLIEEENIIGTYEATLNVGSDHNYYLFFNDEQRLVYLDDFKITIENLQGKIKPVQQAFEIRLFDKNYQLLDTYRKEIVQ